MVGTLPGVGARCGLAARWASLRASSGGRGSVLLLRSPSFLSACHRRRALGQNGCWAGRGPAACRRRRLGRCSPRSAPPPPCHPPAAARPPARPPARSRIIVDCEVNTGAWTLMHRFNKAADLLSDVMQVGGRAGAAGARRLAADACHAGLAGTAGGRAPLGGAEHAVRPPAARVCTPHPSPRPSQRMVLLHPPIPTKQGRFKDVEGSLVRIYVWLRYSAVRQLTWQRNYNTQVRRAGCWDRRRRWAGG